MATSTAARPSVRPLGRAQTRECSIRIRVSSFRFLVARCCASGALTERETRIQKPKTSCDLRNRHFAQETLCERSSRGLGGFEIMTEAVCHHGYADGLDIFGKHHLAALHERPCLCRVQQGETGAWRKAGAMP